MHTFFYFVLFKNRLQIVEYEASLLRVLPESKNVTYQSLHRHFVHDCYSSLYVP